MFTNKKLPLSLYCIIVCFSLVFSSCRQGISEKSDISETIDIPMVIPFELIKNHIILTGEIDNFILKFTLDELGDYTDIHEEFAYQICDTMKDPVWRIFESGYQRTFCKKHISIQISDFLYTIDTLQIIKSGRGSFTDGLIGTDFFYDKIVKIDFDTQQIELYQKLPDEYREYIALELFGTKNIVNDRRVCLEFETFKQGKIKEELVIDLGGPYSYMDTGVRGQIDMPKMMSIDSNSFSSVVLFRSLLINKNRYVEFVNGQTGELVDLKERNRCNGVIGMDILKQYNLIFDYNGKHLYLKPNNNYKNFQKPTLSYD